MKSRYFQKTKQFFAGRDTEPVEFCLICGEKHTLPEKSEGLIMQCSCGFVWNCYQPTQKVLDEFYESEALEMWGDIKNTKSESIRQAEKYSFIYSYIKEMRIEKVLDVGCGTGFFLNNLDSSITKVGIEPSSKVKDYCGAPVYDSFEKFQESLHGKTKYDLITMFGVLEHLKDPKDMINKCMDYLTYDGCMAFIVPNVNSLVVQLLQEKCCTFCPQHLWYFNIATLHKLVSPALELEAWTTRESELQPILKQLRGFPDPYVKLGFSLTDRDITEEQLLNNGLGYKIVSIFKKGK